MLVDYERGGSALARVGEDEARAISVITVSELLQGTLRGRPSARRRRYVAVEQILGAFEPVPVTETVARVHAEAWAGLAERGETIDAHDLWIGATALAHGYGVATLNAKDFGRVAGLRVVAV